jgi:GTP-binding protein HflX
MPSSTDGAFVSSTTGEGLDALLRLIGDALRAQMVAVDAVVPYARGELVARAKSAGDVAERYTNAGVRLSGHLPEAMAAEVRNASPSRRTRGTPA